MFSIPLLLLAAGFWAYTALRTLRERRLRARLIPVSARVTQQGAGFTRRVLSTSYEDGVRTEVTIDDYVGRWEYVVGGKLLTGKIVLEQPVFRADQMPPASVQVYYDALNPAISRLTRYDDTTTIRALAIFAGIVSVVGLCLLAAENLTTDAQRDYPASKPALTGAPGSAPM